MQLLLQGNDAQLGLLIHLFIIRSGISHTRKFVYTTRIYNLSYQLFIHLVLISFAVFDRLQRDPLQDKMKLIGIDLHAFRIQIKDGYLKSTFFQSPVEDGKATLLIDQYFQVRARLIDEDKSITLSN